MKTYRLLIARFFQGKKFGIFICVVTFVAQLYLSLIFNCFTSGRTLKENLAIYTGKALFEIFWRDEYSPFPYEKMSGLVYIITFGHLFLKCYRLVLIRFTCTFSLFSSIIVLNALNNMKKCLFHFRITRDQVN